MTRKVIAGLVVALAPALALAQADAPPARDGVLDFASYDADGDGAVTRVEAARNAAVQAKFVNLDVNRDDKLSRAEFAAIEAQAAGRPDRGDDRRTRR
jgi:hypothetical protein